MQEIVNRRAETALLVCYKQDGQDEVSARLLAKELDRLVKTMGLAVMQTVVVQLRRPQPRFITGTGKAEEICALAEELDVDCIVIDGDVSPSQQRNWEELSGLCVIDRQEVILDIFADRAVTREAMLQVGLARMEYSLPRLTRAWTHLSRQRGGTRGTRGEGETQLEIDRRIVLNKIAKIKKELRKVDGERQLQRKRRTGIQVPTGSIVGYTNAGKSSLLNALTSAEAFVEDKLFATLDATTRKMRLQGGVEVLLSDTVGFIRNLPHSLVESFKSTLDEAVYADFIINLVDISNPEYDEHIQTTNNVLRELGAEKKPQILVFNKCENIGNIDAVKRQYRDAVFISVHQGTGLDGLKESISKAVFLKAGVYDLAIPVYRSDLKALLHREALITSETQEDETIFVTASVPERIRHAFREFVVGKAKNV